MTASPFPTTGGNRLGLRENLAQFTLLVIVNAFVGAMVGLERSTQHLYIIITMGWTIGLASVLLAALLAYPLAFVFDRGNSIAGPAILHTSSNAPVMILALPEDFMTIALLPHMGVIVVSLYLLFIVQQFLVEKRRPATRAPS